MAFAEVKKAIAWSGKGSGDDHFPVRAYLSMHLGTTAVGVDHVTYANGLVWVVQQPTPHLAGLLDQEWMSKNDGEMVLASHQPGQAAKERTIKVEIFPDGQMTYQLLLNTHPIGGMPPTKLQGTDVNDVLITNTSGNMVVTMGVELLPEANLTGVPK